MTDEPKPRTILEWMEHFLKKNFRVSILALIFMRKWPQHANKIFYAALLMEVLLIGMIVYGFAEYKLNWEKYMPICEYQNLPSFLIV